MFKTLKNAWSIPELRKKLMYTAMILLIFRIGSAIPVPFVKTDLWHAWFESAFSGTILDLYNTMSGLSSGTILSLGIQPYINASIIVQLLTIAIPKLERMAKEEGEEGKKKINSITRITTVALGLLMGVAAYLKLAGIGFSFKNPFPFFKPVYDVTSTNVMITERAWLPALVIIVTVTAGSAVVMWLGDLINKKGIGNGISMILFVGIISNIPSIVSGIAALKWWLSLIVVVIMIALVLLIVYINDAERRIPVQYAKRVVGRKIYGGQSTNMPIKVAMSGVMPVIFAQSICALPATIYALGGWTQNSWFYKYVVSSSSAVFVVAYGLLIFFFSWFYSTIQYDPTEIANNLKKNGGFLPGFRPGKPTADFIKKVINKLVVFGAVYLAIVALIPIAGGIAIGKELGVGGTSIIILVSVALETVKALEAQMLMRHYKGFLD